MFDGFKRFKTDSLRWSEASSADILSIYLVYLVQWSETTVPDGKTILSWELSIVLNEFKSFLLIFGSDDMIYLTIAIFRWFSNH